jgi:hypothetical protein
MIPNAPRQKRPPKRNEIRLLYGHPFGETFNEDNLSFIKNILAKNQGM